MNPALILFCIQSVIRLGKVGKDALEQHYRDEQVLFPDILDVQESPGVYVTRFFGHEKYKAYVTGENAPYSAYWDATKNVVKNDDTSIDTLFVLASKIKTETEVDAETVFAGRQARAGVTLIKQWATGKGRLSPLARVIMTAGDIALEYVGANPSILGESGNGERLLGAFAANLGEMLPNDGDFGPNERFAERLLCTFLKAGFKVINENPDWVVPQSHLQELMLETLTPIVDAMPENSMLEQLNHEKIAEAIMGPAAGAAMQVLSKNPGQYFGKSFKPGKIAGALTAALLDEAKKDGLEDPFARDKLIGLYKAALGVAVQQPQLFSADDGTPENELARALMVSCAETLRFAPFPYDSGLGVDLAAAVMDAIAKNAHNFAGQGEPLKQTAAALVQKIAKEFGVAFESNNRLSCVFTYSQIADLGRIVLSRIARTPSVIADPSEVSGQVIKAVAAAMVADEKLLLTGDDWAEILAVAADEAAKNPGRLFKSDSDGSADSPAAELMAGILKSASAIFLESQESSARGLAEHAVFFGPTLRSIIIIVVQNCSGNIEKAVSSKEKIFEIIIKLNRFIAENPEKLGNKEAMRIFRKLFEIVLNGMDLPDLNPVTANNLLA